MTLKPFHSLLLSGLFVFGLSAAAHAATFDFVAEAEGNERGVPNGTTFMDGGVTVTLNAYNYEGPGSPAPYLDDRFNGLPGGLGVCQILGGNNHCNPSSDDNITQNEVMELDFGQNVTITAGSFTNGIHTTDFEGPIAIIVDGAVNQGSIDNTGNHYTPVPFNPAPFAAQLTGRVFSFVANDSISARLDGDNNRLYINSLTANPVPVPSAFILFATGLGALIGGRRYLNNKRS